MNHGDDDTAYMRRLALRDLQEKFDLTLEEAEEAVKSMRGWGSRHFVGDATAKE